MPVPGHFAPEHGSGSGSELYVVIGHAPRHLDRNVTLAGRVLRGMKRLSTLPRGTGALGFYEKGEQRVIRVAADLPKAERPQLEVLRTDTTTFDDIPALAPKVAIVTGANSGLGLETSAGPAGKDWVS
jgi:hypothetical protein